MVDEVRLVLGADAMLRAAFFKRQTVAGGLGFASGKTGFTRVGGTATLGP
jgi:hypothetical protein